MELYKLVSITHTVYPTHSNYKILKITAIWRDLQFNKYFECTLTVHIQNDKPLFWQWGYSNNPQPPKSIKIQIAKYLKRKFNVSIRV